jgi:hypothetical protein
MNLSQFYSQINPKSDKGTEHNYIDGYYDELFSPLQQSPISLLEIGVQEGYSFNLWRSWFKQANITCIDLQWQTTIERVNSSPNSRGYKMNAFTIEAIESVGDLQYDFIIEDGPHTVETQIFAANHWSKKLKVNGKLIIEDIQNPENDVPLILSSIQDRSDLTHKLIDLRPTKGRWDDYIVEITRIS